MDGLNWYAYCNNNPVNFVDPWGLTVLFSTEEDEAYYYRIKNNLLASETAQVLFAIAESVDAGEILIDFSGYRNVTQLLYKDYKGKARVVGDATDRGMDRYPTDNRNSKISILKEEDEISMDLSFVHELAHAIMWGLEIDANIVQDANSLVTNWNYILSNYTEAFAINTQYLVRDEMAKTNSLYADNKANMYYIEDGYYKYKDLELGVQRYGAFPNTVSSQVHMTLQYTHRLDLFYKNYKR